MMTRVSIQWPSAAVMTAAPDEDVDQGVVKCLKKKSGTGGRPPAVFSRSRGCAVDSMPTALHPVNALSSLSRRESAAPCCARPPRFRLAGRTRTTPPKRAGRAREGRERERIAATLKPWASSSTAAAVVFARRRRLQPRASSRNENHTRESRFLLAPVAGALNLASLTPPCKRCARPFPPSFPSSALPPDF
jgi:hypothetical protein